ncbi:hypothetical protein KQI84_06745 [bacterium]|nr:hypothetical protein [bacterium]
MKLSPWRLGAVLLALFATQSATAEYIFVEQFDANDGGWTFASDAQFIAPQHQYDSGQLKLGTTDNTNTFGFWYSPEIAISPASTESTLLHAAFQVRTDLTDPSLVPVVRMRLATADSQQNAVMSATSTGDSSFSPTQNGKWYRLYTTLPPGTEGIRLAFDVLGFDPMDAATSWVGLDSANVERQSTGTLSNRRLEATYDFTANPSSWDFYVWDQFDPPKFAVTEQGLTLSSYLNPGDSYDVVFGFWGTTTPVTLEGNRLYRANYTVSADEPYEERYLLPTMRMRLHDQTFRAAWYLNVSSINNNSNVPFGDIKYTYSTFFYVPPELAGGFLLATWDYLLADVEQNDPTIRLTLHNVDIVSFEAQ